MLRKNIKLQLFLGIGGTVLLFLLWKLVSPFLYPTLSTTVLQILNCVSIMSLAMPPLLVMKLSGGRSSDVGLSNSNLMRQIFLGIGIGLGMATVLTLIPMLLLPKKLIYSGAGFGSVGEAAWKLVYFVGIVGLTEEFVFRFFLYSKMDEICVSGEMPVILSSVLFGLFHFSGFNLSQILTASLIGAFFCICKKRIPNCTLLSLAIAHGLHDWMIRLLATLL